MTAKQEKTWHKVAFVVIALVLFTLVGLGLAWGHGAFKSTPPTPSSVLRADGYKVREIIPKKDLPKEEASAAAGTNASGEVELVFIVKPQYVKDIPQYQNNIQYYNEEGAGIAVSVQGDVVRSVMPPATWNALYG